MCRWDLVEAALGGARHERRFHVLAQLAEQVIFDVVDQRMQVELLQTDPFSKGIAEESQQEAGHGNGGPDGDRYGQGLHGGRLGWKEGVVGRPDRKSVV